MFHVKVVSCLLYCCQKHVTVEKQLTKQVYLTLSYLVFLVTERVLLESDLLQLLFTFLNVDKRETDCSYKDFKLRIKRVVVHKRE